MGTSHSQIQNDDLFKSFHKQQWTKLNDQGLYELWSNTHSSELCEAYKLDYAPKEQDLEHYRFRHYKQTADNFVEIRYIDIEQNPTLCYHGQTYVLTEFIPVKLAEMHGLPHNDGYAILRSSYRAFHTMEAFHGPFVPNEDLIGINLNGKPKIWLNKNHSKNKADSVIKAQIWQKHVGQVSQNVRRIFQMVEQRVINKRFPTQFRNFIYDNIMNFAQASQFVEDYCQQHHITIPNTIQYTQFVEDSELTKIINQYNLKRQSSTLNDKLNTMESTYEHDRMGKQGMIKELKRTDSHQQFGYRENVHFVRSQHAFSFGPNNQPTNIFSVQRNAFSPVVSRTNTAHIVIPPRPHIVHNINQESRVSGPQITIPSQANLRSTVSVMQIQPIQPIKRQIQPQAPKVILYQNLKTPAHVTGNFAIVPPNQITSFQLPVRKQSDNVESVKQGSVPQSVDKKTESIHEKMKQFENDDLDYFNESVPGESEFIQETKDQPRQQEFQKYINNNSQIYPQRSEDFEQNVTSEPDWQNMQTQNKHHQINQSTENHQYNQHQHHNHQYEEYRYEPQSYEVNLDNENGAQMYKTNHHRQEQSLNSRQDDISPIKQNPVKNTQEFENHYAMFTKYAQLNRDNPQPEHNHENEEVANSSSFQPRNLDLNQSVTMSDQDQQNGSGIQIEQNQISASQPHQISGLQSSQQIHRNSSKNTSINKDSSGTLVVHESKQNIYNEISNQERNYKVRQESIQQNSQQSENQEGLDENKIRKQMMNQLLMDNNEPDQAIDQRDLHQVPVRDLKLDQNEYDWRNEADQYDEVRQSGQFQNQNQQTPRMEENLQKTNQYSNLHFRNESDELYQYTPVESVYRTQTAKHVFPSFSRPSGVEDLVQLERHQDIEQYIRNKYSGMIQGNQIPKQKQRSTKNYNTNRVMTFAKPIQPQNREQKEIQTREYEQNAPTQPNRFQVNKIQSLYERIDHYDSHITTQVQRSDVQPPPETNDFLDVGNLEKSLDRKYKPHLENNHIKVSSPKSGHNVRGSQTMSEQDGMNVAALEQRLLKFEERQSIEREKSQRKIEAQNDEPFKNNNDLNFNELDNIVELMDKKIQESQKKQQNKSSQQIKSSHQVSEFNPLKQSNSCQLQNVELQTSINNIHNKEISLKDIPILAKDRASNASNSKPASKRDYFSKFGIDSEDFASGKGSASNDYGIGKDSYSFNKRQSRNYDSKKTDALSPVIEIDRKYENYSSKNISSHEYDIPSLNVDPLSTSQVQRRSSRRSSKQVEQAKRLAEKISSKYDQYMSSETSSNYDIEKPFAKKSYTNIVDTYDNNQNQIYTSNGSSRYISSSSPYINDEPKKVSKASRVSARDIERKRSSYLNPIEELNCENYASPLKDSTPYQNQQNYLKLSNQNSRAPSGRNFQNKSRKSSSKVSYDELRDLLWK